MTETLVHDRDTPAAARPSVLAPATAPEGLSASTGQAPVAAGRRPWRHRLVALAEAATTPLLPADYLDLIAPLRPGADLRARVVAVRPETADAATLLLKPGSDWAGHLPGQYLRLGVDVDGVRHWRAYSLTHGPRRDGLISVTIKAVPGGTVSPFLVHHTRPGTLIHLEQAAGDFVLPDERGKLLFVTAGSGITPVIGMLRNLFPVTEDGVVRPAGGREIATADDIVVLHLAPTAPESIFAADLQALDEAGAIRLIARYDDRDGLFDVAHLADLVPDLGARTTYGCGPGGLLDALGEHHRAAGLPLFVEQFRPSLIEPGDGGSVSFARAGVALEADGATSLLDAAEAAGVLMPSGCRMGICYGCVLPMTSGAVRDLRTGEVTAVDPIATAAGGVPVQTCINAAAGACEIDH